jgi:hypothetical protein
LENSMRRLLTVFVLLAIFISGCIIPPSLTVSLASPLNGSNVISLTPTLTWGGGSSSTVYRLMVAADTNFQNIVVDASNIRDLSYSVPSGNLKSNSTYYWKVIARQGDTYSNWTSPWSFTTPGGDKPTTSGTVRVSATLNGQPWSGSLNYSLNGPFPDTDNSVPWDFKNVPTGTYTVTFNYGGPSNATLSSISPSPTQDLTSGGTIHFKLNFNQQSSAGGITVNATLNGSAWSGNLSYALSGPFQDAENSVPYTFSNLPSGSYTLTYRSGGPSGAVLNSISPAPTQVLSSGGKVTFTLNYSTVLGSSLTISAAYNGTNWSGPVTYNISGPVNKTYTQVPAQINNAPPGTYYISYQSGGPSGATLGSIAPGSSVTLSGGGSAGFTLNYYKAQQNGNVVVNATLNGAQWSGYTGFTLDGPFRSADNQVPRTYNGVPTGNYILSYTGGGPTGAVLSSITPSPTQSLAAGRTIVFNLNFASQPSSGSIVVYATLDGQQWRTQAGSGDISYSINGPTFDAGNSIPGQFNNMASGRYTLNYNSGGPIGATLTGIAPSPTQNLGPGGTIAYTLNFTGQAKGTITVSAEIDGQAWMGEVAYVVSGPYVESGESVSRTFMNAPQGTYTLQYRGGGPPGCEFTGVSPSSQSLAPGGSIGFVIIFHYRGVEPGPMPGPVPNPTPGPMPGPVPNPTPYDPPGPVPNPTPYDPPGPVPNPTPDDNDLNKLLE